MGSILSMAIMLRDQNAGKKPEPWKVWKNWRILK